jgi:hypothetical protein
MQDYELLIWTSADGAPETIKFSAAGVADVLTLAHRYRSAYPAELWQDGKKICSLTYSDAHGFWTIVPNASQAAPLH